MSEKIFQFKFEEYNENIGLLYETCDNMFIECMINKNECVLTANSEGLIALAKTLIKLADASVPSGTHLHLDHPVFLENKSSDIIIQKKG